MYEYKISEIAKQTGIHSNTVRLYEQIEFIPKAERKQNGYRIFTDVHLEQIKFVRLAMRGEVLQSGLRKEAINIIKTSALGDYESAIQQTESYIIHLKKEQENAEDAIETAKELMMGKQSENGTLKLTRKEAAQYLGVTIDTLRNWELNGLIDIQRAKNRYRVYNEEEIRVLKIIRTLRCANYSLMSILRLLNALSNFDNVDVKRIIDTPDESEDVISVCDKLLTSLKNTEKDALQMLKQLIKMKNKFQQNPPL